MSSAPRRVLTVLRPLGGLLLLLLLLLGLSAPAVRGDCGLPYDIPNSQPDLRGQTSFPQNTTVTFKCNQGFVKVPGRPDSVICLANDQWSQIAEFCNRSCTVPPRLRFASLKKEYNKQNYFPVGTVVEYECRPGYRRNGFLLGKITCRSDLEWSKPDEFCKKKSCTNPGDIRNGNVNITTDLLFGSLITFSCDTGYKLVGATSSYCIIVGSGVGWSDPLPECTEIYCPEPPTIENGIIQEEHETYAYGQSITYTCNKGFTLVGKSSIYCTVKDNQGEWSDPPPECRGKPTVPKVPTTVVPGTKVPPTPQKLTTMNVPGTKIIPAPQKPTTVKVPGTKVTPTPQKTTTVNVPDTGVPSTPQKPTTVKVPDTEVTPTLQKPTTVNVPDTRVPSTPQKPTTVNISATRVPSTPQMPTTVNITDTKIPPTLQKPTTVNIPSTEVPPIPQKPTIANSSATKGPGTAQTSPIPKAVSTKTSPAAQSPFMTHASATQTTAATQRVTTAKTSFTQKFPATRQSTTLHVPGTQGLKVTQRFTSARITVTHDVPTAKTTRKSHAASTPNGKGHSSGTKSLIYGKSGSWAIKRNCHHCGMYSPYSWKRILSFNCLRKTIKMQCLQVPKRKWVNAFYQHVLWTPLGTRYVPVYSQPCSCSKVILGQLQVTWPISQVVLRAYCINPSF